MREMFQLTAEWSKSFLIGSSESFKRAVLNEQLGGACECKAQ